MSRVKHKIVRALLGVVAVAALSLAVPAGTGPVAHADGGVYPFGVYGPGGTCCFTQSGYWAFGGGVGLTGNELYTWSNGPDATSAFVGWNAGGLDPHTLYDVCAYIPNDNADAHAQYHVSSSYGAPPVTLDSGTIVVDQSQYSNQWAYIGSFIPTPTGHIIVHVSDRSDDPAFSTVIGADAMMFIPAQNVPIGNANPGDTLDQTCVILG
jgi:hypothetical protein